MKVKCKNKYLLVFLLSMLSGPVMRAQPFARAKTSTRSIVIGDPVYVWLEVQLRTTGTRVVWPHFADSLKGLEWVEQGKIDTLHAGDTVLLKQRLTVTGFDSGQFYIPAFTFTVTSPGQPAQQLRTDSFPVHVQTIAVDTTRAFKPIKGIVAVQASWLDYWKQIAGVLAGIAVIILLVLYFTKWRKKKAPLPEKVSPEQAHERALRLLAMLRDKQLWQSGKVKEYYAELSDIIRNYLENRFGIPALEQTTDELLAQTHKMRDLKRFRKELRRILQTADLAKFAKAEPMPEEQEGCMDAAVQIVQHTKMTAEEGAAK